MLDVPASSILSRLRGAFLPAVCAVCSAPLGGHERGLCHACWSTVLPDPGARCPRCGAPSEGWEVECLVCQEKHPPQDSTTVWGVYDGTLRRVLLALKHHGHDELARPLGLRLAHAAAPMPWLRHIDTVTWVPTHPYHRLRRGWSAARLLAHETARALELPTARLLKRRGLGRQATRSRAQRLDLPASAFGGRGMARGGRILLVDDVMATGSTIRRACGALLGDGAAEVHVCVLAAAM